MSEETQNKPEKPWRSRDQWDDIFTANVELLIQYKALQMPTERIRGMEGVIADLAVERYGKAAIERWSK
jgi:hypothetical protein